MSVASETIFDKLAALGSTALLARHVPELHKKLSKQQIAEIEFQRQYAIAERFLMNGPQATRPRPSTVRRMMRCLKNGGPSIHGAVIKRGRYWVHPTKGHSHGFQK